MKVIIKSLKGKVRFGLSQHLRILPFIAGEPQMLDRQKYPSLEWSFHKLLKNTTFKHLRAIWAGGAGPTTPTSVGLKILLFMVKALCFQSFGQINNCQTDALFRWSDQSWAPSAASVSVKFFSD